MSNHRDYHFKSWVKFRLLELTEELAKRFVEEVSQSKYALNFKKTNFVGVVPLNDKTMPELLMFYKKYNIDAETCDIFMSISTGNDTEVWSAPKIVNRLLKHIDCEITFSFTCT